MSEVPSSRIGINEVMRHRAIQAAFPKVEASFTRPVGPLAPTTIDLNVISTPTQPQSPNPAANASAFCETACIFNPKTKNPEILAFRQTQNIDIVCNGVDQEIGKANLLIPKPQDVREITALAPCGVQLDSTGVPALLLGRTTEASREKPEIKRYPWYDPFGRFVSNVNSDYTSNSNLLTSAEIKSINDNTAKQVRSLKAATLALVSVSTGLGLAQSDPLNLLALTGSFGSMAAFGSAWFGISFGNIRKEFLEAAVKTTEKMLKPLLISMASTYSALIAGTLEHPIAVPFILLPFGYAFLEGTKAIF